MSIKKALGMIVILAVAGFVVLLLINQFWPNPTTQSIYTLITVTVPEYIQSKIEWVMLSLGGIVTAAGGAMRSINKTKDEATAKITDAQREASNAKNFATDQFTEIQQLTTEKQELQGQVTTLKEKYANVDAVIAQKDQKIRDLEGRLKTYDIFVQSKDKKEKTELAAEIIREVTSKG